MKMRLKISLFFMRVTVFCVMLMWCLDKFINPSHSGKVFEHFYFIKAVDPLWLQIVGGTQLIILLVFLVGIKKRCSYGLVFLMHLVSTLSSYKQYLNPWPNLLFFAAWPMLAACLTLYLLRKEDTLLSWPGRR